MDQSKAEAEVRPYLKRVIYLDHKDRQRQAQTRDQRGANLDDYRQILRHDKAFRQSIKVKAPSLSSIVKHILPKALWTDEYKIRGPLTFHSRIFNHENFGAEILLRGRERSGNHGADALSRSRERIEQNLQSNYNRERPGNSLQMSMITRLGGAQKKSPRKQLLSLNWYYLINHVLIYLPLTSGNTTEESEQDLPKLSLQDKQELRVSYTHMRLMRDCLIHLI